MENFFNVNLKALLMKHNMSQTELANRLGVKPQAVSRYLSGKIFPSIEVLILISEIFGYSLDQLIRQDLTSPDFVLKEPLTEYQKAKNIDKLISAFESFTQELKEFKKAQGADNQETNKPD